MPIRLCWHKFDDLGIQQHGQTVNWAWKMEPAFYKVRQCQRCGAYKFDGPYLLPKEVWPAFGTRSSEG